jgi:hypothetical protein
MPNRQALKIQDPYVRIFCIVRTARLQEHTEIDNSPQFAKFGEQRL